MSIKGKEKKKCTQGRQRLTEKKEKETKIRTVSVSLCVYVCVCVCVCVYACMHLFYSKTNPKIGGSKAVGGGHIGGSCCVGVEGIDVGQQGAHHCRDPRTHVLRRQTGKVAGKRSTSRA